MFISYLKICNFMSFVGENEVALEQFSAIMCSTEIGKKDFCTAMEFLFGRDLSDIGMDSVEDLYHHSFLDTRILPVIEVSAVFETRIVGESLQISRFVRDGEMVFVTNESEVNPGTYEEIIRGMGCWDPIRFSCDDFVRALWDYEGIETVISNFFGVDYKYEELQRELERSKVTHLALKMQNEKHCLVMMRQHADVDKVVDEYQKNLKDQESRRHSTIENLVRLTDEIRDYEPTPPSSMDFQSSFLEESSDNLELDENGLTNALSDLTLEEVKLSGSALHYEAKLSALEQDVSLIQQKKLEKFEIERQIRKLENNNHEVWLEMSASVDEISQEMAEIEQRRAFGPACVKRLTAYGRLIDWIKCGQFTWIFRAVLGEELLCGHLLDERKDAEDFIARLKDLCVTSMQTFIILSEHSPKLKELLFELGERQSPLKNYTEVMTLLSKFREYGLITKIPALVNRGGLSLEALDAGEYVIFTSTGEYVSEDGVFGQYDMKSSKEVPVSEMLTSVNAELQRQDMLCQLSREQIAGIFRLRLELEGLTKETRMRRSERVTATPVDQPVVIIPEIFREFSHIFQDYENSPSGEKISYEDLGFNKPTDVNKTKSELKILKAELAKIGRMKEKKEAELASVRKRLNTKFNNALQERLLIGNPYIQPQPEKDKSVLTLASRMKEIEKIINSDEVEELKEGVQWRNMVLENLHVELNKTKKDANYSRKLVLDLLNIRESELQPFIQFCNESMPKMLEEILGEPVAFQLKGIDEESFSMLKMFINFKNKSWFDIMDGCVFLRCVAVLVLFLHAASFRNGAVLLIDDVSGFFPKTDDDAKCILGKADITLFDLMVRVGDAIRWFLAKIREEEGESPKKEDLMNLDQVILFTSDDLAISTDAQVIIVQDMLSDTAQGSCVISAMMNV